MVNASLVQSRLPPIFLMALLIFSWYSSFQSWTSSTNFALPRSYLVCCFTFQSVFSTTFCVAMPWEVHQIMSIGRRAADVSPAWSQPGSHKVVFPFCRL